MAYDGKILRRALQRFEEDKRAREERARDRREGVFHRQPRLREIDAELRATMSRILSTALRKGTDPRAAVEALKKQNLGLQEERRLLLEGLGLPADCLEEKPACPLCGDSGWREGRMCRCLRAYCAREQQKELSRMLDLGNQSFESFSLEWYSETEDPALGVSPRENMELVYEVCLNYAQKFGKFFFQNLFLTGDPGLGKTFLSACIARTVAENGFSVVYDTASTILTQFEEGKFARDTEEGRQAREETNRYLHCDLLILDDLGSEARTPFFQSALYTLVNTRLVEGRATVISSNLSMEGIRNRYSGQVASRLEGEYQTLRFYGEDIRLQRKQRG